MKQSPLMIKIVMSVLLAGVLLYFGIYLIRSYQGGITTVLVYSDAVNLGIEATGMLVREEIVLSSEEAVDRMVDLLPAEGEKVARGDMTVTLYASSSGLETKQQIRTLEAEIEQLGYVFSASGVSEDTAKLDADVLSAISGLRAGIAKGDLSGLEEKALNLRTLVFKRDFTYSGGQATDNLFALIQEKKGQLARLRTALGAVSTTLYAPVAGTFSGLVDGYEDLLSPALLDALTPSRLLALQQQKPMMGSTAVGKLITSSTWYFAAVVEAVEAEELWEGDTYTVSFSRDWSGQVEMTLERISEEEGGQVALIFSCREYLAQTTLLRHQTVDVITSCFSGLRVPSQALRALPQTVENEETGETEQISVTGVYVAVGARAEFKPVNVIWQGEDFYLVEPAIPLDTNGMEPEEIAARALQPGDEIIISSAGLYDGKIIR